MKTNMITSKNWQFCCSTTRLQVITWGTAFLLLYLTALISPAHAVDDDVPFFAGGNGAPNIMFIFDNSDSMQDIPYRRADGRSVRPGTNPNSLNSSSASDWMWRTGVKLNAADNTVNEVGGVVQYDYNAFPSETEMPIPEQTPVNLPLPAGNLTPPSLTGEADVNDTINPAVIPAQGLTPPPHIVPAAPLSGNITNTTNTSRIYDTASTNWTTVSIADFTTFYYNRYVKVVSGGGGVDQYRTINGRDVTNKFFTIDTTATAGGVLNYSQPPYTYTILTSQASPMVNTARIYDNSLDWSNAALGANFNTNYLNRRVKVVSSTGGEQIRTINGYNTAGKYFTIDTATLPLVNGGPLVYEAAGQPYTYEILLTPPGNVTYAYNTTRVYDANVDWSSITSAWNGRSITVTSGTNAGETRTISSYNAASKYWTVSAAFSAPCDPTSTYVIKDFATDPSRIYDADLDWTTPGTVLTDATDALFNLNYRYRVVEVRSKTGVVQQRTILSRSVAGKYFTVDVTAAGGGPLVYDPAQKPYTYTILTDGPGRVTRVRTDNLTYVTDADFDWSTRAVDPTAFDTKWLNRALIITTGTPGANKDLKRRIIGYDVSDKRWVVDIAFPVACDLNTRFKIIGVADDNRLAFGGNHPASKLYQAKKAMQLFLADSSLKTCIEKNPDLTCKTWAYSLNMGFATYLSARVPRVTAKYYRIQPGSTYDPPPVPEQYCGTYKRTVDDIGTFTSGSATTFDTIGWKTAPAGSTAWVGPSPLPQTHTGVIANSYQFDRLINEGNCQQQVVRYTVTAIASSVGPDGATPQYTFTVRSRVATEGGRWETSRRCLSSPTATSCTALPATDGVWSLIPSGSTCYAACTINAAHDDPPYTTPDLYQSTYRDTYGYYNLATTTVPQYVDRATHLVNPWYGYSGNGWTPKNPPFASGDYQLVTTPLLNKPTGYNTTTGVTTYSDIQPDLFDTSYFMYPGDGSTDRPHGWSYKRTFVPDLDPDTPDAPMWIYGHSNSWTGTEFPKVGSAGYVSPTYPWPGSSADAWKSSTWKDGDQKDPYFPAVLGDEMSNFTGDDQAVFVNLPVYDGTNPHYGDDIAGLNLEKIKEYTSLTRVPSPNDSGAWAQSFDYTIMPYSKSLAPNAYSALQGSGTPLAASLQDVKKYYNSYIMQDSMTQGGCRKNYVVLITDGLETGSSDPDAPKNAAKALLDNVIDGKAYPIETFVIGLGLDAASQAKLNVIAAAGTLPGVDSEGHPIPPRTASFANNTKELVEILVKLASNALSGSYSRSPVAITTYKPGEDLHLYSSYFDFPSWKGHLKAYNVDPGDGSIIGLQNDWTGDCNADGTRDADAGCEMKLHGSGTVYTSILHAGTLFDRITFDPTNSTTVTDLKPLINPYDLDIDKVGDPLHGNDADAATIMHYTLESGYDSGKYKGTRDVDWPLGDIYNSGIVVVGAPKFFPPPPPAVGDDPYAGYAAFKAANASRETRIYVGANDGMVHAIKASDGHQSWAYIPNSVLGTLYEFQDGHRFTVDLPLKAADIYSPGGAGTAWSTTPVTPGNEKDGWHTLLVGGLRGGGYSYFALDVTHSGNGVLDPENPEPAWEMTDVDTDAATRDMGKTWSAPAIGHVMIDGVYTSVIIVGGGLSAEANKGNNVYIINAGTGAILKEIAIGDSTNHVPSEVLTVADKSKTSVNYGNIIKAYFGDTNGDLWKLADLNDEAGGAAWNPTAVRLYDGVGKVFHKPAISTSKGGCTVPVGGIDYTINTKTTFILYGTGDEENPTTLGTTDRIYEIADPPLTQVADPAITLSKVWERQFSNSQKMLTDPLVSLGTVYFITYTPEGGCAQGESFIWGLTTSKCGNAGMEPGLVYNSTGGTTGGPWESISLGAGMTSGLVDGGGNFYYNRSDGSSVDPEVHEGPKFSDLQYWREEF